MTDIQEEIADNKANVQDTTTEETESEVDNKTEEKVEPENQSKETKEIESDYLEDKVEKGIDWEKRYSDSSTEAKRLAQEKKQYELAMQNLEKLAQANPRILAEIEAAQGLVNQSGFSGNIDNSIVQQQVSAALEPIKKIAEDLQANSKKEKAQTLAGFEQKNPLPFPPGATQEQKKSVRQTFAKTVEFVAQTQGVDFKEAINRAYLTMNPKAAMQRGKDEAYLEAQSENLAGFTSQTSSEGKQTKVKYTKAELERAKKLDPSGKLYKSMIEEK